MSERGIFGVWLWEVLPVELRLRTITDLAKTLMTAVDPSDSARVSLRTIQSMKTEEDRKYIGSALRRSNGVSLERLAAVGF
jgi:hypothetical protein